MEPATPEWIGFAEPSVTEDDIEAVTAVLRSGWLTTGKENEQLERELADYLAKGVPEPADPTYVVAMASCTAALEIAYAFLGLPAGARVAVPTWTFVSSATTSMHHGARPVLLDVDPGTLNLAPASLSAALEQGLDAVVAVHFGGVGVDEAIHDLCRDAGVPLIEDAAHALGTTDHRGRIAGQGSIGAAYSFYATKNLTCAEGGALATQDPELAEFARSFRLHGMSSDAHNRYRPGASPIYDLVGPGLKANLPDVLAAMARSQLRRFDALQAHRREIVERYRAGIGEIPGVQLVPETFDPGSADHLLCILLPEGTDRPAVIEVLRHAGVATSVHFRPLHLFPWLAEHADIGPTGLPVADDAAPRALTLPLHDHLDDAKVDRVVSALADALA